MERPLTMKPLSIQDENSTFNRKKPTVDGKSKNSRPVAKKGGVALENRKALNDITNKKFIHCEASSQNKSSQDKKCDIIDNGHMQDFEAELLSKKNSSFFEKLDIAEEGFLHDHSKCVQAQKSAPELNFWDIVFPGHGSADTMDNRAKHNLDINITDCFLKLEELPMLEFSESWYKSPPMTPIRWDSSTSPFAWDLEPIELSLKEDDS